jgi:hypothetical protein
MNEQEINTRFEAIEKRLDLLENKFFKSKQKNIEKKEDFSGLAGGIRLLIKNGFLNSPKDFKEIKEELKREGYHYSNTGVISTLTETFIKNKKILTRIKENKFWKYVIRK